MRLDILENSLAKKQSHFDSKLDDHFTTVRQANGQPLNDKRNGQATLNKWDRQNKSLRNLQEGIEKTERAIEIEKGKIADVESAKESLPSVILEMIESGRLVQWRKHPNTFFVKGVSKARIGWDAKKKIVFTRYKDSITDQNIWTIFRNIYNELHTALNVKL